MSLMVFFVLSFFPRDVFDEIWDIIGSVFEGFLSTVMTVSSTFHHREDASNFCNNKSTSFISLFCYTTTDDVKEPMK